MPDSPARTIPFIAILYLLLSVRDGARPTVIALGIAAWFVQEGLSRRKSTLLLETSGSPPLAPAARNSREAKYLLNTIPRQLLIECYSISDVLLNEAVKIRVGEG